MARLVYKLVGQKRSADSDRGYYAEGVKGGGQLPFKPMNVSRSLPRYFRIREKRDGKIVMKRIAYAPTENTVYMDEFIDPSAKIEKVKFKRGILVVDDQMEPQLKAFIEKCPYFAGNPNRTSKDPVKFILIDNESKAREILDKEKEVVTKLSIFWDLPMEMRRAIANSVGIATNKSPEMFSYELFDWAKRNVDSFVKKYEDPDIEYMDLLSRAEVLGIMKWGENTWKFNDVPVLKVSATRNRYNELLTHILNEPQLERAISNAVAEKEGRSSRTIGEQQQEIDFAEVDASTLLKLAKDKKVVRYQQGVGHEIVVTGYQFGEKSVASAEKAIEEDGILRDQIIVQLGRV